MRLPPKVSLLALLWLLGAALQAEPVTVHVLLLPNPPYTLVADDDSATGFLPDLFGMLQVPGYRWSLEVMPWSRALGTTRNDRTGLVLLPTLTRTSERESQFRWVAPIQEPRYFFIGRPTGGPPPTLESLKRRPVVVLLGNSSDDWLKHQGFTQVDEVSSLDQMVKMVLYGRVDYLLKDVTSLSFFLRSNDLAPGALELGPEVKELELPLYIAGGPFLDPNLERGLRAVLDRMRRDGSLDRLWNRWQN
jgi:ABC-type amino acid transport substrate-binding protein